MPISRYSLLTSSKSKVKCFGCFFTNIFWTFTSVTGRKGAEVDPRLFAALDSTGLRA